MTFSEVLFLPSILVKTWLSELKNAGRKKLALKTEETYNKI